MAYTPQKRGQNNMQEAEVKDGSSWRGLLIVFLILVVVIGVAIEKLETHGNSGYEMFEWAMNHGQNHSPTLIFSGGVLIHFKPLTPSKMTLVIQWPDATEIIWVDMGVPFGYTKVGIGNTLSFGKREIAEERYMLVVKEWKQQKKHLNNKKKV